MDETTSTTLKECIICWVDLLDGKYGWINEALTILGIVVVFNVLVRALLKKLHQRFQKQKKYWKDCFVRAVYKPMVYFTWFVASVNFFDLLYYRLMGNYFFALKDIHLIMQMAGVVALCWFALRWNQNIVQCMIVRSENHEIAMDRSKIDGLGKLATLLILFFGIFLLLETTNRSLNTLIAFGGVGGLALAFASQEVIANFFGGLMIYLTRPFTVGDWVTLPDKNLEGNVEEIGWYMTRIRTFEKRPVYVPNSIFSKIVVINPSRMTHRQFKENIGLRFKDYPVLKTIIAGIRTMLSKHPDVDHHQRTIVNLNAFGTSSLEIRIDVYITRVDTIGYSEVREDLLFKIADIIHSTGAEMAMPTSAVVNEDLRVNPLLKNKEKVPERMGIKL